MKKHILGVVAFFALLATLVVPASRAQLCTYPTGSGSEPVDILYEPNGNRVFVSVFALNEILVLRNNCAFETVFGTNGSNPRGLAFDGTNLWIALYGSNAVEKLNVSSGVVSVFSVGTQPYGVAFDGTYIWVTNSGSNNVTKLVASTGVLVATIPVGSFPFGVAVNSTNNLTTVWVANRNSASITILDQNGFLFNTISTGAEPQFFALNPYVETGITTGDMWVSCYSSQIVEQFSSTGGLLASYAVTGHGQPLGLSIENRAPYAVSGVTHNGTVFSINTANHTVLYTGPVGSNNYGFAYAPVSNSFWGTDINQGLIFEY